MNVLLSLIVVVLLGGIAFLGGGAGGARVFFGVVIPYSALSIFLLGICYRVILWSLSAVPFSIPTTSGQQKTLPWIKNSRFDSPYGTFGVIVRMAMEVLFFRSLLKNSKAELRKGPRMVYGESKLLWMAALAFHWSFLVILLRHFRFFMEPAPFFAEILDKLDGFLQIGAPVLYMTDIAIAAALLYLLYRRLFDSKIRYISLLQDFFPLFLLLGIVGSGICMRYFSRVDVEKVKELALGLFTFSPSVPDGLGGLFYLHLFLLSVLLMYFPFSKLMHMGGVFLSPTRNMANNSRAKRHVNPWDYPVNVHTYEEWEEEFHDVIKAAGLPLDKE